jgi:HK97 family phage major capsid protein
MSNIKDLALQLEGKRHELKAFLSEIKGVPTDDQKSELEKRESELVEIKGKYETARKVEDLREENDEALKGFNAVTHLPMATTDTGSFAKTLGQYIVESGVLKNAGRTVTLSDSLSLKTVMSSGAGYPPFSPRDNVLAQYPTRALTLLDVIPQMNWGYAAYKYPQVTTFTNAAAAIAESAQGSLSAYPEGALAFQEKTVNMQKVAVNIPVTDEQLEDAQVPGVSGLAAYLDQQLSYMVRASFETGLVSGDGTGANLTGMTNVSGIQTQAKGSDSIYDAVLKGITKVEAVGFANPTHVLMHPTDMQTARISQNAFGQYIWDNPTVYGPSTFFGLPIIKSTALTAGTAIVIDMNFNTAVVRRGVDIQLGYSNADFVDGMKRVRADIRGNFVSYRPQSICTVTGL